jgi:hypothetical protein
MHLHTPLVLELCGTQVTGSPEGHIMTSYPLKPRCCVVATCLVCIDCVELGVRVVLSAMLGVGLHLVVLGGVCIFYALAQGGFFFFAE